MFDFQFENHPHEQIYYWHQNLQHIREMNINEFATEFINLSKKGMKIEVGECIKDYIYKNID